MSIFRSIARVDLQPASPVIEIALPGRMATRHLAPDFGFVAEPAGQVDGEQFDHVTSAQLTRAATELSAMLLATLESAPARNSDGPPV